jgi:glycosyltransferase involved in cell wall biosynthesis
LSQAVAWPSQPPQVSSESRTTTTTTALVVGRAFHSPWTEGTRVINRNFARAVSQLRPVRVLSVTHDEVRELTRAGAAEAFPVQHIFTQGGYGLIGIQRAVPHLLSALSGLTTVRVGVAHLFGVPVSIAPWLRQRGVRVVVHVMAVSLRRRDRLVVRASQVLFKPWVDAFAVTSDVLIPQLAGSRIPSASIFVVPPAIDTQLFQPADRRPAKRLLGLDPDEPLVLYLGRVSPRRFPAETVAVALTEAARSRPGQVRFLALSPDHTFDGSENSAAYVRWCSQQARQALSSVRGVAVDVRLGSLEEPSKVAFLQAADAVLFPFSAPEAVEPPLSLIEAMACGATVIATPAANRSGLITSGHNGLICEALPALGAQLGEVLVRPEWSARLGQHARATALERHSFAMLGRAAAQVWQHVEWGFEVGRT